MPHELVDFRGHDAERLGELTQFEDANAQHVPHFAAQARRTSSRVVDERIEPTAVAQDPIHQMCDELAIAWVEIGKPIEMMREQTIRETRPSFDVAQHEDRQLTGAGERSRHDSV